MAKVGWTVQSAFEGRNGYVIKENNPTPCRAAAQSNNSVQATPVCAFCNFLAQVPGAPDRGR